MFWPFSLDSSALDTKVSELVFYFTWTFQRIISLDIRLITTSDHSLHL